MAFDHLLFAGLLVQKQARTLDTTRNSVQIILLTCYVSLSRHPDVQILFVLEFGYISRFSEELKMLSLHSMDEG